MAKLLILVGLPGSGRDTYASKLANEWHVISRDEIREGLYGKYCFINNFIERNVSEKLDFELTQAYLCRQDIVLNNTNCKESYIDKLIAECPAEYNIELKFFDIPLWKAYMYNYWHSLRHNAVPYSVTKKMKRNFDKINKSKYKQFATIL